MSIPKKFSFWFPLICTLFFSSLGLGAFLSILSQTPHSEIYGYILDSLTHQPIESAQIVITESSVGTTSNAEGYYHLILPPGRYQIRVEMIGYDSICQIITVQQNQRLRKDFYLRAKTYPAKPIWITGEKYNESIFDYRLSSEALTQLSSLAETDVLRTIQNLSGVGVTSDYSAQLYIRGSRSDQTLITFDDVVVYNPYHLGGIFSMFNSNGVEKIEFQPGIYSAAYGGRLAGRLNVAPKPGDIRGLDVQINLGLLSSRISAEGTVGKGAFFFGARRTYVDILEALFTGELGGYYFYDFQGGVVYSFNPHHQISLQGFYSQDALTNILERDEEELDNLQQPIWGNRIASFRWTYQPNKQHLIINQLSFSNAFVKSKTLHVLVNNQLRDISFKHQIRSQLGKHHVQAGFGITRMDFSYLWDIEDARNLQGIIGSVQEVFFDGAPSQFHYRKVGWEGNLFIQGDFNLSSRTSLSAGLRGSWHVLSKQINPEPRLQLDYRFSEKLRWKATYAQHTQYVYTLKEIQNEDILAPFSLYFPILRGEKPLRDVYYAIGLAMAFPDNGNLKAEVYYKRMKNIPGYHVMKRDVFGRRGRAVGMDLEIQKEIKRFYFSGSYSLTLSQFREEGQWVYTGFDRRHILKILGGIHLPNGWKLHFYWTFLSGSPYTPVVGKFVGAGTKYKNVHSIYPWPINRTGFIPIGEWGKIFGKKNSLRYPSYHRLDIGISKNWKKFSIRLQVLNVYNRNNPLFYNWNFEYRQPKQEKVPNIPIIPTVEFSARF